ncbi:hypothetical protein HR060_06530 [Catenovulum sp. SM1970]|uniref:hypothetical protein n=1 Tax=Marinifaba aquimaris TaxID=2741323 RepID=UPI001572F59E|nr:hypothetical protein [Marinifaba aquimaris]NTS76522.1 hypothetical protein [Marinifaba aquimaris]
MLPKTKYSQLALFIVAFVAPVLLAAIALKQGWFERGVMAKGELLSPVIQIEMDRPEHLKGKWLLLYGHHSDTCDQSCQNALSGMNNVRLALGRELDRVEAVLVSSASVKQTDSNGQINYLSDKALTNFSYQNESAIFIADPLNNVMLKYPISHDAKQSILVARDLLKDLKKMLKLSKIG